MKRIVTLLATLCLFQSSHAATAVPDAISYQGRALTATGALMGAGTPVNRTVIFRIWDHASNSLEGNLIYSEQQVVTIAEGEFSVLVGTGASTANTPLGYSETTKGPPTVKIGDAFGGVTRYLGVTIDDGTAAVDNEISPRQQIVSGAFSLRSKFAESIGSASDLTLTPLSGTASNYGLGWYGTGRLFGTAAVDGPVLYGNSGGALGSNVSGSQKLALSWDASGRVGIGATSITSATNKLTLQGDMATSPADQLTIRGNADTTKRLLIGYDTTANKATLQSYSSAAGNGWAPLLLNPSGGNVGVNKVDPSVALDVTGAIKASTSFASGGNIIAGGNVGIGTTTPGFPLNFAPVHGPKISFYHTAGNNTGIGVQPNLLQIHGDSSTTDIAFGYGSSAAMTETMRVKGNGNVGIGTSAPLGKFTVNSGSTAFTVGTSDLATGSWIRTNVDTVFSTNVGNMWFGYQGNAKTLNFMGGGSIPAMHIASNGNVGIGTTSPTAARLVLSGVSANASYSMWANGPIVSTGHITYSDERIKNIQGRSDRAKDLETLLGIEVTDYRHKDVTGNGNTPQKKVIAQQVEKVFPQAVSRARHVVPDIYQKASLKGAWISLESDLKVGDRVRLTSEKLEGIFAVLEVAKGKFRTEFSAETDEVFVYGREVSDFRVVDYDAISMLNVSATQQVKREKDAEIQTLRDENAALRRELAAKDASLEAKDAILEAKDASLETRLIALERRMAAEGANKTVSLKTAQAVK